MLYKLPMPLVVCGIPAATYVLCFRRWRALFTWPHAVGLLLFLAPWVPWVIAALAYEPLAWQKWRVEFVDRFSGNLPNVEGQSDPRYLLFYLLPPAVFCLPYSVSLPGALATPFMKTLDASRRGRWFMFIWFVTLFLFFTIAVGKETRYLLPALPPLFVLLGLDLSRVFADRRAAPLRGGSRVLLTLACLALAPAVCGGAVYGGQRWFRALGQFEPEAGTLTGQLSERELLVPLGIAGAILGIGLSAMTWLFATGRRAVAFGAIVGAMWGCWLIAWPTVFPIVVSQAGFRDFAQQLEQRLSDKDAALLRQIAHQDPRVIWYGSHAFPRLVDEFDLLQEQKGSRTRKYELRRVGDEMVRALRANDRCLLVIGLRDYVQFRVLIEHVATQRGEPVPPMYVWIQPRYGRPDRNFILLSNQAPPDAPPVTIGIPDRLRERIISEARQEFGDELIQPNLRDGAELSGNPNAPPSGPPEARP